MRFTTTKIAYLALLIALGVVLTRIASIRIAIMGVEGIRIGLGGFPIIFAGFLFGPVAGGIVGAITDIIGFASSPMGPYLPHFTLTAALTGILPALVLKLFGIQEKPPYLLLFLAVIVGQGITSLLLVPYFLHTIFGLPYQVIMIPRFFAFAIEAPFYSGLAYILFHRLDTIFQRLRPSYQ
ncbi:MAG: folate family ECF transporter S component [bacterium]|jgi:ECF transporter S component (folate family)